MRLFLVAIAILIGVNVAVPQPPDTSWSITYQYESNELVYSVRSVSNGGFISCGTTDAGPGVRGSWVMRADEEGNEIWSLLEGGGLGDASYYIEPTRDGGFIQAGSSWSYSPELGWNNYIRKLNADGAQEWFRLLSSNSFSDYSMCVRELPDGGFIAAGKKDAQPCLWRLGPQGNTMWIQTVPFETWQSIRFVEPTQDGGFLVASEYPHQFNITKTNEFGCIQWAYQYQPEGTDYGRANCVREAADGSIYACGRTWFTPTGYAWYVIKTDAQGNMIWDDIINPTEYPEEAHELVITPDGNIVVAGGMSNLDYYQYGLMKYNPDGDVLWQSIVPDGEAYSMDMMRDGGYIYGGLYVPDPPAESIAFHLIKTEPEVDVTLQTWTPVIPSSGEWLRYGARVDNILLNETSFDAWITITGPNGVRLPIRNFPVTIIPGQTITRPEMLLYIPPYVADGTYALEANIGVASGTTPPGGPSAPRTMGYDSFQFTKGE